jgi:hypothetical protein
MFVVTDPNGVFLALFDNSSMASEFRQSLANLTGRQGIIFYCEPNNVNDYPVWYGEE